MEKEDIKRVRKKLKMSVAEFAELFCHSPRSINAWEQGVRKPGGLTLKKLKEIIDENS